ncbi:hypothetical protein [Peribacillus alkalitolerans]|uniref:hypothetical protein n=1 Tax=Peribacillus alkalitolerans TaxID=1550385 RepID=UPI0013D4C5B9|nr:hypothetical protein [Peribacillus alkalitolerans]
MEKKYNVTSNLKFVDVQKFDELMRKFKKESLGRFYQADCVRECIRFTWENITNVENLKCEIARLNKILIKLEEELIEKNKQIEKATQVLQKNY